MAYLDFQLTADPEQIKQDAIADIADEAPAGWVATPLIDWLLSAVARMVVLLVTLAGRVPDDILTIVGERLLQVPALDATAATSTVTITAINTTGYTLADGAQLDIDGQGFITTAPATITPGSATVAAVPVAAVVPGAAGNVTGPDATLIAPSQVWVQSITLDAPADGGVDAETTDEYLDRFPDETPTLAMKAIYTRDFERIARRDPEVAYALAIRNLVPPATTGVAGAVTVAVMDADRGTVSTDGKTRVETSFDPDGQRVMNIDVYVIDFTYNTIDVDFDIEVRDGYDQASVVAEAEAAVTAFLAPPQLDEDGNVIEQATLYRNDLLWAVRDVEGVRRVVTLELALGGDPLGTADLALDGPAAVTTAGAINGTVV